MTETNAETLSLPRTGPIGRLLVAPLLLVPFVFMVCMAVFVAMDSKLQCGPDGQCLHVERYPFGVVRQNALAQITDADTEWSPGGRSMAVKLVLHHADGSVSEYEGVGTNGERAQRVAKDLKAYLAHPGDGRTFQLREGSVPAAIFVALLGLLLLLFLPYLFSSVVISKAGDRLEVVSSRWPAPARRHSIAIGELKGFGLRHRTVMDQEIFSVWAEGARNEDSIDLGVGYRMKAHGLRRVEELNRWLTGMAAPR